MPPPGPIRTTGTVLARRGERLYEASLPNGKTVLAHVPARRAAELPEFPAGSRVRLELTTYDFSTARIAGPASASTDGESG